MGGGGAATGGGAANPLAALLGGGGAGASLSGGDGSSFNVPSRPGYQMVPMSSIQSPLGANATEKHVSILLCLPLDHILFLFTLMTQRVKQLSLLEGPNLYSDFVFVFH